MLKVPRKPSGFSLLELMIVLGVVLVLAVVSVVVIPTILRSMRADTALTYVQNQMRAARQKAIDERRQYQLSFIAPQTMSLLQGDSSSGTLTFTPVSSLDLPFDMTFGLPPNKPVIPPDGYGSQSAAIDFSITGSGGGGTVIYFNPDGSVVDNLNGITSGVVYLVRTNDQSSARAVTLFGATGRIKGWRMGAQSGSPVWVAQ